MSSSQFGGGTTNRRPSIRQPPVEDELYRLGIQAVLFFQDASRETFGSIGLQDRHGSLENDGAGVELGVDEVDGRAGHFHAVLESLALGVEPGKRRQQRGVDIENPVGKGLDEVGAEKSHEPCQADEIDAVATKRFDQARSYSARVGWCRCGRVTVSIPAACARFRPTASATLDTTTAIVARSRPAAMASMIACRFDPRPEISTPSLFSTKGSGLLQGSAGRDDLMSQELRSRTDHRERHFLC